MRAFGQAIEEPCHPDDMFSECYDWTGTHDDDPSPGPDVGGGPGVDEPCDPHDVWAPCYDPSLEPKKDPQSPGPSLDDPWIDLTDPKFQSKRPAVPGWMERLLDFGGELLEEVAGNTNVGAGSGGGSGGGSSGGGGGGERKASETDQKHNWLLWGALGVGGYLLLTRGK